jgi:cytochrome c
MRLPLLPLLLCLTPAPGQAEPDFEAIKIAAGAQAFALACAGCHAADATGDSYGPPLEDVSGRVAGTWFDYPYSDALRAAGFVWTDDLLRAWMADNTAFLPDSKMRHDGIDDPVVQDLILSYLHSISQGE